MKNIYCWILVIAFSSIHIGCYENIDNTPSDPKVIITPTDVFITTQVSGSIYDPSGSKSSSFSIVANNKAHSFTNDYYLVEIENAKKRGQTLFVHIDGAPRGIRTELLTENDVNLVDIVTHDILQEEIREGLEGSISISNDISVDLARTKSAEEYSGDIIVDYTSIDEQSVLTTIAYSPLSDLYAVETHGGFYLKISKEDGTPLKIDPSSPVLVNIGDVNERINALFVYDEEQDLWKWVDDVFANGQVSISAEGYYAFGRYVEGVVITGRISKDGGEIAYQSLHWSSGEISNTTTSSKNGNWIACMPESENISVDIRTPCNTSIQKEEFSTTEEDKSGQFIDVLEDNGLVLLPVNVVDCSGMPLDEPILSLTNSGDVDNLVLEEGEARWISVCDNSQLTFGNKEGSSSGPSLPSSAIEGAVEVISACEEHKDGYAYIRIREDMKLYDAFDITVSDNRTEIASANGEFKIFYRGIDSGVYDESSINIVINDQSFGQKGYKVNCENSTVGCGISSFEVAHIEDGEGELVKVDFSGEVWMQTINPAVAGSFPIQGTIFIKR